MFKKKNKWKVVHIKVPTPKKWSLDGDKLEEIYEGTCRVNECDYDIESFLNGFILGLTLGEDDEKASLFLDPTKTE